MNSNSKAFSSLQVGGGGGGNVGAVGGLAGRGRILSLSREPSSASNTSVRHCCLSVADREVDALRQGQTSQEHLEQKEPLSKLPV